MRDALSDRPDRSLCHTERFGNGSLRPWVIPDDANLIRSKSRRVHPRVGAGSDRRHMSRIHTQSRSTQMMEGHGADGPMLLLVESAMRGCCSHNRRIDMPVAVMSCAMSPDPARRREAAVLNDVVVCSKRFASPLVAGDISVRGTTNVTLCPVRPANEVGGFAATTFAKSVGSHNDKCITIRRGGTRKRRVS